ncbi:MAG: 1-(5-phosphoribosyl)-5-[(5-phosphoribosylamino)methylideneamino]imidazole-4-carboxamide isomerase [Deltaproteobacteria bacterium]|jgi:phosphoribosylformimino-5-aminoimidazole carboxamide ribotide isomerase|nr:1-(5-phosphoribosyl)-5-[(5-phosphoribosylamino)methylideneamino]imidazole-4-carboxamide isomerase [Deltaproteobacteria bacterium]MCL5879858.1 1-(5-phosphoribosyl)-5-[(5-phosphoribosylamino)methylideneamino]imidazole-4-carboxamide isomerase [Deltaproteobacteria bacterium]MDA8303859.1 1-(5-phosphoribosyl)-5-[(5-phosphoribosylamino)methylideneamino]imidazole-4-carboxamide isomerase [Deltaproteobacteria bacterium]
MVIIPAVDILGSKCVRLTMGDYGLKKEYELSPLEAALNWQKLGAKRLHLVDLDGAKSGNPDNFDVIRDIIKSVKIPVEVGGGIRDNKTIESYLDVGASYIVLGSILFKDIDSVSSSLLKYKGKIIAGIDLYDEKIAVSGWKEFIDIPLIEAISRLSGNYGIETFIFTDIKKDGMLSGVNLGLISGLAKLNISLIASGGVSALDDIIKLKELNLSNLKGVIVGKALYDGRLDLEKANALLS